MLFFFYQNSQRVTHHFFKVKMFFTDTAAFIALFFQSPRISIKGHFEGQNYLRSQEFHIWDKARRHQLAAQQDSKGLKELTSCHSICPHVFGSIVPFKCLFYCSTCLCCFMSDDQTWEKASNGTQSGFLPRWLFTLSAVWGSAHRSWGSILILIKIYRKWEAWIQQLLLLL